MRTDLLARLERLRAGRHRVVVGIAGCPGAGKSTLAEWLVSQLDPAHVTATTVPMDGFHLADAELDRLGRRERKGAIDTFDGHGYLALLARLRRETGDTVYAPAFDRTIEQPIAGRIPVFPETGVVVTEGNYLLDDTGPWPAVRGLLDEVWFCDIDDATRQERLVARHIRYGKTPSAAREWVLSVDERNAERIRSTADRADLLVNMTYVGELV